MRFGTDGVPYLFLAIGLDDAVPCARWLLDNEAYPAYFYSILPAAEVSYQAALGRLVVEFGEDMTHGGSFEEFAVRFHQTVKGASGATSVVETILTLDGGGTARYATRAGRIDYSGAAFEVTTEFAIRVGDEIFTGEPARLGDSDLGAGPIGDDAEYTCEADVLRFRFLNPELPGLAPVRFHRIEE